VITQSCKKPVSSLTQFAGAPCSTSPDL